MEPAPRKRSLDAPLVWQFVKYGVVGASNTALTFATYSVGVWIGVPYLVALIVGYIPGALNSYLLNRHWTFDAGHLAHSRAGTRFAIVQSCAILANLGLLYLMVHHLHVDKIAAQAILTIPVVAITFFVNRSWTFGGRAGGPIASPPAAR
ncbi:MAG TPA: GtrA family protein [Solirubrobacteraceae bacterium]|nr:GtrA family protein [Solirubrobacteraceae bacterium]